MTKKHFNLPLLPLRGILVFPGMVLHLVVGRPKSVLALEKAMMEDQKIFLTTQRKVSIHQPEEKDVYNVGTVAKINQMIKLPNDTVRVLVEGLHRAEIVRYLEDEDFFNVELNEVEETAGEEYEEEAFKRLLLNQFSEYIRLSRRLNRETFATVSDIEEPGRLADMITSHLSINIPEKQKLLETFHIPDRITSLLEHISDEKKVLNIERKIDRRVKQSMEQTQKEYYLREQLKAIQKELGDQEGISGEVDELRKKLEDKNLPEHVFETAEKELSRFEKVPQSSAESSIIRNYLDWLLSIPWTETTEDIIEVERARKILDKDHYGLEKVKERILEYLAVQKLTDSLKGPIICLVGPPGVGKTSLANSIAESINRNFVRISL